MIPVKFGPLPRPQYALLLRTLSPWTRGLGPVKPVSFFTPEVFIPTYEPGIVPFVPQPLPLVDIPEPAALPRFSSAASSPNAFTTIRIGSISAGMAPNHPVSFARSTKDMPVRRCPSNSV